MDENELDVQKESTDEESNSGVTPSNAASSGDSASDTTPKTPPSPRSSDDMLKAAQIETPSRCMRLCMTEAYDFTSIRTFCQDFFELTVHKEISTSHTFEEVQSIIIKHCTKHNEWERFWRAIQTDRPDCYPKYYPRWLKAVEQTGSIESISEPNYKFRPDNQSGKVESIEDDPLNKSSVELTRWFFKELQQNERGLLLTAALFEGMSRQKMLQVATQLEEAFAE